MSRYPTLSTTLTAASVSATIFIVGLLIGYTSIEQLPAALTHLDAAGATEWSFLGILTRNLGAAALMYAGIVSGGVLSVITMAAVAVYVGATAKIGSMTVGLGAVAGGVAWYAPIEFLGCMAAACAGLYPAIAALSEKHQRQHGGPLKSYLHAVPHSLMLFAVAAALIAIGAGAEILVISQQVR
ncbi:putative membrane protein SpoIIM required for sporulation [Arthrobacter sp. CAN_A212]|uniref:hypothetical protein n=1 Tax=Arthrobacter sp. CAN_A212 TaxID=2787719 RepID=UPI0018C998D5